MAGTIVILFYKIVGILKAFRINGRLFYMLDNFMINETSAWESIINTQICAANNNDFFICFIKII